MNLLRRIFDRLRRNKGTPPTTDIVLDSTSPELEGDWYVEADTCMSCGAPPIQAPDLMGLRDRCYFHKQPSSEAEVERACKAAETSCCDAIRYRGSDERVRSRIRTD
jgi:hypothetical protein